VTEGAREIVWKRATVDGGGRLNVPLTGAWDEDWNESFKEALGHLLRETRGGVWREVVLIRDAVTVNGVEEGSENALRAFLELVVHQANQDVGSRKRKKAEREEERAAKERERGDLANRMTERFRSFSN
jgi:hypothetical protein